MAGAAILEVGKGFGTWLIPVIIFSALGSVAFMSLIALVCVYLCRPRKKIMDQEPETTYETYRTPTTAYRHPSLDGPVDSTIGRLVAHSRSLRVPRNQLINGHSLRTQVSSPELRNTSQPPPYTYRAMLSPLPHRTPRPYGQVYLDNIIVPQQPQQLTPSPGNIPTRPEIYSPVSSPGSPGSYTSTWVSTEEPASAEPLSPLSTPSNFSQESLVPMRTPSWIYFPKPRDSDSDSADSVSLLTSPSRNDLSVVSSILDFYGTEKIPIARPRRRSEADGRTGRSWRNNRRLIIVDNNLVSGDSEVSPDPAEVHTHKRAEVSRPVRDTLEGKADARATAANSITKKEEKSREKEPQVQKQPPVGHKTKRVAVFKVTCPDTGDLWKMAVIPGETLGGFSGRVKQKTGGDVVLFVGDEILASERDWEGMKGGGRIVARLIR